MNYPEPPTVQYPSPFPPTMDLNDVEMLSASLIREYLARKVSHLHGTLHCTVMALSVYIF